jgi:hypothetical protein
MLVTEPLEALQREGIVGAFSLLQAQNVGLCASQKARDQVNSESYRIDIPGGDFDRHGAQSMTAGAYFPTSWPDLSRPSTP